MEQYQETKIDQLLESEQNALKEIDACRLEAEQIISQAKEKLHQIKEQAENRISQIRSYVQTQINFKCQRKKQQFDWQNEHAANLSHLQTEKAIYKLALQILDMDQDNEPG